MFLEAMLSVSPLVLSFWAFRLCGQTEAVRGRARRNAFRASLLVGLLASALTAANLYQPFPLQFIDGGFSDSRNLLLSEWAVIASTTAAVLSAFGRGRARLLQFLCSIMLVMLSYGAFLSRG